MQSSSSELVLRDIEVWKATPGAEVQHTLRAIEGENVRICCSDCFQCIRQAGSTR